MIQPGNIGNHEESTQRRLFIKKFMKNRQIRVRSALPLPTSLSGNGDSPWKHSFSHSGLKINSIIKTISPGVECSLCVYR